MTKTGIGLALLLAMMLYVAPYDLAHAGVPSPTLMGKTRFDAAKPARLLLARGAAASIAMPNFTRRRVRVEIRVAPRAGCTAREKVRIGARAGPDLVRKIVFLKGKSFKRVRIILPSASENLESQKVVLSVRHLVPRVRPSCHSPIELRWLADSYPDPTPSPLPPVGVYEGCSPAESSCIDRLATLKASGFSAVLNYSMLYATRAELEQYLDRADALGLKLIWPLHHPVLWRGSYNNKSLAQVYQRIQPSCQCDSWQEFIDYMVAVASQHPSTYQYYVGDEIPSDFHDKAKAISDRVKQKDPSTPRLFVSNESAGSQSKNLKPFVDVADVLGSDTYPVGAIGQSADGVRPVAASLQALADANNKPSALVLQSFAWSQYPGIVTGTQHFPNYTEMREMRNWALAEAKPSLILWFAYYNILKTSNPQAHYQDLVSANFDLTPPDTSITQLDSGHLALRSSETAAKFECSLNGIAFTACQSPYRPRSTSGNQAMLAVRAVDALGAVDPTPARLRLCPGPAQWQKVVGWLGADRRSGSDLSSCL